MSRYTREIHTRAAAETGLDTRHVGVPFEEWLDGWLRAHPECREYDKEAMRDAFNAGRSYARGVDAPAQAEPWQNRVAQRFAFDSGVSAMRDRAILAIEARHESGYDCTPTALVKAIRDAADPANPYGVREGVND